MATLRRTGLGLLAAAAIALCAGCGDSGNSGAPQSSTAVSERGSDEPTTSVEAPDPVGSADAADAQAELKAARQRWHNADLDDYTLVVEDNCGGCSLEGRAKSRVVTWGGQTYASGATLTVDDAFVRIETAIAEGREVAAVYDDKAGYPFEVVIDPTNASADDGSRLTIHELRSGLPGETLTSTSFEQAAQRWQATHPHAYEYVLTVACDGCPFEGRLHVKVVGDTVVDQRYDSTGGGESAVGVTIDDVFRDLGELFGSEGGLIDGGVLINGTAEYDPTYGYPNWIGLDLEVIEQQEWNRDLPPRLVYMMDRFTPLDMDDYCTAVDDLFSMTTPDRSAAAPYSRQLQRVAAMAPSDHVLLWELLQTLAMEPFDYQNFNPAADALDETADSLVETCPALGIFAMNDDGFVTYRH